jgi:hypothetical protein
MDETFKKTVEWYSIIDTNPTLALLITKKQIEEYFNFQKKSL